jgi:hypothetical protein
MSWISLNFFVTYLCLAFAYDTNYQVNFILTLGIDNKNLILNKIYLKIKAGSQLVLQPSAHSFQLSI